MPPRPLHALIIGGSRGIGLSIAQLLARNAYTITLLSRNETSLKAAISTLDGHSDPSPTTSTTTNSSSTHTRPAPQHAYIAADITAPTFWTHANFAAQYNPLSPDLPSTRKIDVLINCAGITQSTLFTRTDPTSLSTILSTNLTAMMLGTRYLLRHRYFQSHSRRKSEEKRERVEEVGKGEEAGAHTPVIINVASLLGLQGGFGAVAYAASKAGVLGFTRALATETGGMGVRVNAIVPGYIETDMTEDLNKSELIRRIPLGRLGKPTEVAQAALFLAQNEYAHNCVINLDGGLSAV
ncbi:NAD(P)-binding protein [Lentithecium fluviatile CBS 122367]|uniref:NAD(P)-binding protein n=1 Tax=Lentithecium fluviatile CBS 122367 TaxID=1168545 RepID=A0A6G1IPD2_9PLEO|nr:NAD(P)-binding protein [Lentithecium fluviatile CBS 122367]